MARAHREMFERSADARGREDPLVAIGTALARRARVLVLDELEISDVADAMVIKRLLDAYFARGGTLVTTSNCAPERLYEGGINRTSFEGFVHTLRARCEVVDLRTRENVDYRRRARDADETDETVFVGDDDATRARLSRAWEKFTRDVADAREVDVDVVVAHGRRLRAKARAGNRGARFTFDDICGRRSRAAPSDYVALAERFEVICVEDVPRLPIDVSENEARRFINLVDVLYEHRVVLLTNLWTSPDDLFDAVDVDDGDSEPCRDLTLRERTRAENAFQSELAVTAAGGSSGRSTTMLAPELEWSATGRVGASLAHVSGVNFTRAASPRAVSRLHHMRSSAYFNRSGSNFNSS
jgi:predicted ATPase